MGCPEVEDLEVASNMDTRACVCMCVCSVNPHVTIPVKQPLGGSTGYLGGSTEQKGKLAEQERLKR